MKILHYVLGILCSFALVLVLLITSVEAVAYWTPGYYEKEYTKYHVTEAVSMELSDLLAVTKEMMTYLKGDREDLHVPAIVNGQPREFFNEREIAHMEDVRSLFIGAIALRRVCILLTAASVLLLLLTRAKLRHLLPRALCVGTGLFFTAAAILAGIISTDFTKYFTIFHEIFFHNDLWILDPRTDLLINIVPEPFFVDTAVRIALLFGISILLLFLVCSYIIWKEGRLTNVKER